MTTEQEYEKFYNYSWDEDENFTVSIEPQNNILLTETFTNNYQKGLDVIKQKFSGSNDLERLVAKSKVLYFKRQFSCAIDVDSYNDWVDGLEEKDESKKLVSISAPSVPTQLQSDEPTKPLSYEELADLIMAGKPIPGIKTIPNTVLENEASAPQLQPRKKPWEVTE